MELEGAIKSYDWGKLGAQSKVATLAKANNLSFNIDNENCYAELWMGDHVSGPSIVSGTDQSLDQLLAKDKELIGGMSKLPFLLKVLSIGKALSIQVHPSKSEAEKLFASRPDLYKDPNHKPELAIALTPFLALCGFRPYEEIYTNLKENEPLYVLIGAENVEQIKVNGPDGLRHCFSLLMHSKDSDVHSCIAKLNESFQTKEPTTDRRIFHQLNEQFPNDVGSLCLFFLNVIELQPGQAIFLPAKEPHAYLSGDCIECMACSDNVVRAGLTPKYKDVETLLAMLNYDGSSGESKIFQPKVVDEHQLLFAPAVEDFAVVKIQVSTKKYRIKNSKFGSIIIVLAGKASANAQNLEPVALKEGKICFVPATSSYIDVDVTEDLVAYQAMYNDFS
ncbi:mannose-6-phosphate isomerase [Bradysia coprophila]|uniref:mannose-6-phosphate isomerase n=1 Tax=Bradysia coprophila TaxID=38358 RepID=UPI00187D6FB6|nr:mannose-6-phosphate isomerase [Bradysia coprophila]